MKYLWLLGILAATSLQAAGKCPSSTAFAQQFFRSHYAFFSSDATPEKLFTPTFNTALQTELRCTGKAQVCALEYDPWLGAQDGEMGKPVTFEQESYSDASATAIVVMHYPFVLSPDKPVPQAVHFVLKKSAKDCWQLHDFITPLGESLAQLFAGADSEP